MNWDEIQAQWKQEALETDKKDLLGLLTMRFGPVPDDVREKIEAMTDGNAVERLILVAANVPAWETFMAELKESKTAFRIVGSQYQPF
ncbi:MAG: hypothetical protein K6T81_01440 [Alicyclobacillus macrosporangiidus]|uniref:hypothetical protein n=1 Tax=Alicyclobacillus macrosporangiidus TaxID=392015 RepID=UPI0026EDE2F5|nr:hypothetical protein [Alicyclobacillus macrosporangiidus]MCL6597385.1 hypothetical protein [Alicyclobacillus macrosporangiidus]